jgi:hypothetical protein
MLKLLQALFIGCFLLGCSTSHRPGSLPETFLESLDKENFDLLAPFLPTPDYYKSLGKDIKERTDEEILQFLSHNKAKLKDAWQDILNRTKERKLRLQSIRITETLEYLFGENEPYYSTVVVYEYNNRQWDDMVFLTGKHNGHTYLLAIPNATQFLSMENSSLRNSEEARMFREMNQPGFSKNIQNRVKEIIEFAKQNNVQAFTESLVYRGEDETRRWKTSLTMQDTEESRQVHTWMSRIRNSFELCSEYSFAVLRTDREEEGTWLVQPVQCGERTIYFALLKIGDRYLLGDMDSD